MPIPGDDKLTLPGIFLAWAINSASEFGIAGFTVRISGLCSTIAIGAKSLSGSYSSLKSVGAIVSEPAIETKSSDPGR